MKYFVKSFFYGWKEVDKKHFDAFIKNIQKRSNPTGISKAELIKQKTKILDG